MITIEFFRPARGSSPIEDYLDTLADKHVQKVLWVLRLIQDLPRIPQRYLKKLQGTEDIWEVRVSSGNNIFRLLGFFTKNSLMILTNGFTKKSQKTPRNEIETAERRKKEYLSRRN
jgi:phage-related protein